MIINLYAEMNRENNGVNNLWAVISLFCLLPDRCLFFYCKGISYLHNEFLICKKERTSKWVCSARYLYTFAQANIYKLWKNENNFFLIYKYRVFYLLIFRIISFFMFAAFKSSKRMRYLWLQIAYSFAYVESWYGMY